MLISNTVKHAIADVLQVLHKLVKVQMEVRTFHIVGQDPIHTVKQSHLDKVLVRSVDKLAE